MRSGCRRRSASLRRWSRRGRRTADVEQVDEAVVPDADLEGRVHGLGGVVEDGDDERVAGDKPVVGDEGPEVPGRTSVIWTNSESSGSMAAILRRIGIVVGVCPVTRGRGVQIESTSQPTEAIPPIVRQAVSVAAEERRKRVSWSRRWSASVASGLEISVTRHPLARCTLYRTYRPRVASLAGQPAPRPRSWVMVLSTGAPANVCQRHKLGSKQVGCRRCPVI